MSDAMKSMRGSCDCDGDGDEEEKEKEKRKRKRKNREMRNREGDKASGEIATPPPRITTPQRINTGSAANNAAHTPTHCHQIRMQI